MALKVVVVGGGIVGVAVSWQLAKAGADVTLLEAGTFGSGATNASFAWLNSSNKTPREYHDLNVAGIEEYRRLQEELGDDAWLHWSGHVEWYGDAGGADRLREKDGDVGSGSVHRITPNKHSRDNDARAPGFPALRGGARSSRPEGAPDRRTRSARSPPRNSSGSSG